ncbi:MAG: hypothetical protein AB7O04_13345, partial [Hyphomonadaceae bacterium]
ANAVSGRRAPQADAHYRRAAAVMPAAMTWDANRKRVARMGSPQATPPGVPVYHFSDVAMSEPQAAAAVDDAGVPISTPPVISAMPRPGPRRRLRLPRESRAMAAQQASDEDVMRALQEAPY